MEHLLDLLAKMASELKKEDSLMLRISNNLWSEIKKIIPWKKSKVERHKNSS